MVLELTHEAVVRRDELFEVAIWVRFGCGEDDQVARLLPLNLILSAD